MHYYAMFIFMMCVFGLAFTRVLVRGRRPGSDRESLGE